MAGNAVEIPPAFEDAVRDFITEQLLREPFCTVGTVEEQLLSLLGKVRTVEENLVRGCAPRFLTVSRSPNLHPGRIGPRGRAIRSSTYRQARWGQEWGLT